MRYDKNRSGRWPRTAGALTVIAGIVVLTAACSSGSSSSSSASADANAGKDAAFQLCMASHGVNVTVGSNGAIMQGGPNGSGGSNAPSASQVQSAETACRHLLPNGGQPSQGQRQQSVQQALKYVNCMRAHGVPNMADPTSTGDFRVSVSEGNSPQFQKAQQKCQSLLSPGRAS